MNHDFSFTGTSISTKITEIDILLSTMETTSTEYSRLKSIRSIFVSIEALQNGQRRRTTGYIKWIPPNFTLKNILRLCKC